MTYSEKLKDPRWQKKRLEILDRDQFTCRDCGAINKTLHIHHCHYYGCDPWDTKDSLLLTLCEECHEARGLLEADAKLMFAEILARLPHQPGNQEDLNEFVSSLCKEAYRDEDDFNPLIMNQLDFEFESDIRWFQYAYDHPEARPCYEHVTGYKCRRSKEQVEEIISGC